MTRWLLRAIAISAIVALVTTLVVIWINNNDPQAQSATEPSPAESSQAMAEAADFGPQLVLRLHCTEDGPEVETTFLVSEFELPQAYAVTEPQMLGHSCAMLFDAPEGTRYIIYSPSQRGIQDGTPSWKLPSHPSGAALTAYSDGRTFWKLVAIQFPGMTSAPVWEHNDRYDNVTYRPSLPTKLYAGLYPSRQ
jgi:hypothetical protein